MNKLVYIIAALLTLTLFSACGGDDNNEVVVLTSITIDPVDKDLYIGDTYQLTVNHQPTDVKLPKLTWTSSDTKVATVSSSGKVTAVADGVVTITAKYGDLTNSVTLDIFKIQNYTSLIVSNETRNSIPVLIIAYYKDNKYYQINKILNLEIDNRTEEVVVREIDMKSIFIFTLDIVTGNYYKTVDAIPLVKNKKNNFKYISSIQAIKVDNINDPAQFPF